MSATSGSYKSAGLPNIVGTIDGSINSPTSQFIGEGVSASGAFYIGATTYRWGIADGGSNVPGNIQNITLNASLSSGVYGNSTTVQPASYTVKKIIKY